MPNLLYWFGGVAMVVVIVLLCRGGDYRNRIFYRKLYTPNAFRLILFGWRLLGGAGAWVIARSIGLGYALTHPATVRTVRSNIALLNPHRATYAAACRLFMNQAECFSTYGRLALGHPSEVMNAVGSREGFANLKAAHDAGRGCFLVTGHLGFFELGGLVMTQLGFPMTALTLPEPSPALTQWRADFRARWGVKTIVVRDDSFSVLDIVRTLREGGFVASLADRPYDEGPIPVECPHGHILFSKGPVLLSLLASCPIIPVGIIRQPDGKYHIEAGAMIEPRWLPEGRKETLAYFTRQIASALIPMFARAPEQWYHFSPLLYDLSDPAPMPHGIATL
jgi:lauroyl/myristoyl acyltransferase